MGKQVVVGRDFLCLSLRQFIKLVDNREITLISHIQFRVRTISEFGHFMICQL